MKSGKRRFFELTRLISAGLGLALLSGCLANRQPLDKALLTMPPPQHKSQETAEAYHVGCPDVLEVRFDGSSESSGQQLPIGVDGRIDLGSLGKVHVEGQTAADAALLIAGQTRVPAGQVHVAVADYRSQKVYIFGQVKGREHAVPFRGQETVLEVLKRAGGITSGAEANKIYVVRANVADGGRPEVFPINLSDIVFKKDNDSNLTLQANDQIYIGETRRSSMCKCLPPILRPIYKSIWGLYRAGQHSVWPSREPGDDSADAG
jgi:protein involved in polysaccharide export with SLBB domain